MNNLEDIYTNIFVNIENYYYNYLKQRKIQIPFIPTINFNEDNNWKAWKKSIINCLCNGTCTKNIVQQIGYMEYLDGIKFEDVTYYYIPVYIAFSNKNEEIIKSIPPQQFNQKTIQYNGKEYNRAPPTISFFINIITHNLVKPNSSTLSVGITDTFYRELSYMEMSVDIFNHIYQPNFEIINNSNKINDILTKYNIELQCMGSMFSNDPVNKRLCGLPKIITRNIVKEYPDIYRVLQNQGVNYRKVINSGTHNPFTK